MRRRGLIPAALIIGLSPVVTWWLVGDLSEDVTSPAYLIKPPDLADSTQNTIGATAGLIVVFAIASLAVAYSRRLFTRHELVATIPLLAIGVFVGFSLRVFTAGVSGANIGAGILILFGLGFIPAMLFLTYRSINRNEAGGESPDDAGPGTTPPPVPDHPDLAP